MDKQDVSTTTTQLVDRAWKRLVCQGHKLTNEGIVCAVLWKEGWDAAKAVHDFLAGIPER